MRKANMHSSDDLKVAPFIKKVEMNTLNNVNDLDSRDSSIKTSAAFNRVVRIILKRTISPC